MTITVKMLTWKDCPPVQFVRRWETLAQGPSTRLYEVHPGTKALARADLRKLYLLWKDRSSFTKSDTRELSLLVQALPEINAFRAVGRPKEDDVLEFYDRLTRRAGKKFSLKLFALHVALPRVFPPFSASRLEAYRLLTGTKAAQTEGFTEALLEVYFKYQKFFFELSATAAADISRVDRALVALGQFLESYKEAVEE
jgi:hypothetical protein